MRRRRRNPDVLPAFVRPLALIMVCGLIIIIMIYMLITPPNQPDKADNPDAGITKEEYAVTYDEAFMQQGLYLTAEVIKEKGSEGIAEAIEKKALNTLVVEADYRSGIDEELSELFGICSGKNIYLIVRLSYVDAFEVSGDKEQALTYCIKAADAGADEINLDYVGTVGSSKTEFIKYIYEGLSSCNVKLSADFYVPMECSDDEKAVMAAEISSTLTYFDCLCPVIYPSYYEFEGSPTIYEKNIQLIEIFEELLVLASYDKNVRVRPWLQAFDGSVMEDYSAGAAEAAAEAVRAVGDCGMSSYVLYNPKGEYDY